MENYVGYKPLDYFLTKFIETHANNFDLKWRLLENDILKKISTPDKEFNKKIVKAYGVYGWEDKVNESSVNVYVVFGKYIRKDFYSKDKYDEKTDFFFTLYVKDNGTSGISPAKYVINQREYKGWLMEMFEEGQIYKSSLEVKNRSKKIQEIFTEAENRFKSSNNSNDFKSDLEDLF